MISKKEMKRRIRDLVNIEVEGLTWNEKIDFIYKELIEIQIKKNNWEQTNKGKPWEDEEIKFILQHAPTKENILKLAKIFKRGYGSIEQIYRWAAEDAKSIKEKRDDDKFINQILKVRKQIGWRAT